MRLFIFLSIIFVFISCNKSENKKASVDFSFQAREGETNYQFANYFTNGDGIKIRIEVLQFYIADIRFVNKKGEEVNVSDIALIKLDQSGSGTTLFKIPAGEYTSIRFGIGVPSEMNEAGPSAYTDSEHPLNSTQNTYWGMNAMYRFVMIDGKYDLTGDGTDEGSFSYHTGFNDCYREIEWVHDFSFDKKGSHIEQINLDLTKLFYATGSMIDVTTESNFHGDYSQIDLALRLSDNFAAALTIQ